MVVKNITRLYYHVWYLNCLFTLVCGEVDLKIKIILLVERERERSMKKIQNSALLMELRGAQYRNYLNKLFY